MNHVVIVLHSSVLVFCTPSLYSFSVLLLSLGTFARGVASLMLKMVKSLSYGAFDHSFGTKDGDMPHIVTSLYQGVDKFIMTPYGEQPPKLGRPAVSLFF